MTIELIQAIVRQTTILIAQLATSGGGREPLARVASQVFLDLVTELERQGVNRKVSADMFGLGLRTFQRKIRRITESSTDRGRSLWEAVLDYVTQRGSVLRADVMRRFSGDDESLVRSVLNDLCDGSLIIRSGHGPQTAYRAAQAEELGTLRQARNGEGFDEFVWAFVYREGPLTRDALGALTHMPAAELEVSLERLVGSGRIEQVRSGTTVAYKTSSLCVPFGSLVGREAAVFDHFQAMVKTIVCRLREIGAAPELGDRVGGSTYTLDVWPGHPLQKEAEGTLAQVRSTIGDLRRRIEEFNVENGVPDSYTQVVLYMGQCLIPQDSRADDEAS
jgi:hypothetical protein